MKRMECKSIQCSTSSTMKRKYEVFVSFRGEDIRNNFADHLFGAFRREGILFVFRDSKDIKQGDHITTELMQAIEGSHVLIPIFSKNYAASSWCLEELAKIMDCKNNVRGEQHVLPVFYDVSPSEVRKQSGDYYGKAFAEHEERFKHDQRMVQRWREALVQVASISGWDIQNKPQGEEIEKIVKRAKSILGCKLSNLDGLKGMHSRVEQLEKLLVIDSNDNVRVVGICGMGGIGKTTLARAVYGKNFHRYGATCFIDDVSKVYGGGGLLATQKQLICQILNEEIKDIWNVSKANYLIKTGLCHQKALIVLDNVDKVEQLEKLGLNRESLCRGSRIIIVSRDWHILNTYGVDEVYNCQLLSNDEAHQLICRKAFKHDDIMSCDNTNKEYQVLTDLALKYAQGLPLAIEVLGSFLYGRDISEWRSALARLRDNPKREIMDVLQISFDALEPTEKEIFLDIACFFNSYHISSLRKMLECRGYHPDIGIRVLVDKSLIIKGEYGEIRMHGKLQELGMNIVRQQAPNEPGKWSRIWRQEDFNSLMFEKLAMDNIEALVLESQMNCTKENTTFLRAQALSRMKRLRFLILRGVNFSGSLNYLSKELRFIDWDDYPFTYLPSSCELINLVELHLVGSNIKQLWEGIKPLYKLRAMDLSQSKNLAATPDFSGALNLEVLILQGCTNLEYIHPSIGLLTKLVQLTLTDCTSLMSLPKTISDLTSLQHMILKGCSKAFQTKLSENARHIGTISHSATSSFFKRLKLMFPFHLHDDSTRHNDIVGSQIPSMSRFYCLRSLDLCYCSLVNIPESMASLCCLEVLYLEGNNFVTLPAFITKLSRLRVLKLSHCKQLKYLFEFPLFSVFLLKEVTFVFLDMFNCPKIIEMESLSSSAISCMIRVLKVHKGSSPSITIVIPGTKIPWWFKRQSNGDSISVGSFPNVHDSNWIGISFCATFMAQFQSNNDGRYSSQSPFIITCVFQIGKRRDITRVLTCVQETSVVTVESLHLCLLFFTRQELTNYYTHMEKANMDADTFSFRLVSSNYLDNEGLYLEVKNCGVRVVFKQDLEELVSDE